MAVESGSAPGVPAGRRCAAVRALLVATAMLLAGCATTGGRGAADDAGVLLARAADATSAAVQRLRGALEQQDLQRRFHDAAEHGEESVLALLRRAGVGQGAGAAGTRKRGIAPGSTAAGGRGPLADTPHADAPLADPSLRWPVDTGVISSEFGRRWGRSHHGIDIAGTVGTPVVAAADGEVLYAGSGLTGYGNVVILRHGGDRTTLYAHNSALKVRPGQRIRQGEVVALLGNTGRSTGPHLHFEIRRGEVALDPRAILPPTRLAGGFATPIALVAR